MFTLCTFQLDTVATVIAQPPSTSSLIELLRIATPTLLASSSDVAQRRRAEDTVRDASQREKLFRTLQLRIHPDKHPGDERATGLFQEVTLFYGRCVDAMGREDQNRQSSQDAKDHAPKKQNEDGERRGCSGNEGSGRTKQDRDTDRSKYPQWFPWWYRHNEYPGRNPRRPSTATPDASAHSDYENCDYDHQYPGQRRRHPRWHQKNGDPEQQRANRRQPSSHYCIAALSAILFPPLGLCALMHSFRVRRSWDDGRYGDARDHSDRAYSYAWYGCLCFAIITAYILLGDGDHHWDWDRIKHDLPWNSGP